MKKSLKIILLMFFMIIILWGGCFYFFNKQENSEFESSPLKDNDTNNLIDNITISNNNIDITLNEYGLELPINNATGYTSIEMELLDEERNVIQTIEAGTPFKIIKEEGEYWYILVNEIYGYVENKYCMINLPDVIPSIIYNITNSYSSIYHSNNISLPNITGLALYDSKEYNQRFNKEEFLVPTIYGMAKKIAQVQNSALKNGESLEIYEAFRPYDVQMQISSSLSLLMQENESVNNLINNGIWGKSWFVAVNLSNHQKGIAIDTSLVKIKNVDVKSTGNYSYLDIVSYEELNMPTPMHELSSLAVAFEKPVSSVSKTAWKNVALSSRMTDDAIRLQNYFTSNNLYPLASEWWHFNDLETKDAIEDKTGDGHFYITVCLSDIPS